MGLQTRKLQLGRDILQKPGSKLQNCRRKLKYQDLIDINQDLIHIAQVLVL